jgi:hypothetical protein
MPKFDDVFTQTHAGDGVNVFEFDSRTAPRQTTDMTWQLAVNILQDVVRFKLEFMDDYPDDYPNKEDEQADIQNAWVTILRGV